jgi:hypothetical protein
MMMLWTADPGKIKKKELETAGIDDRPFEETAVVEAGQTPGSHTPNFLVVRPQRNFPGS